MDLGGLIPVLSNEAGISFWWATMDEPLTNEEFQQLLAESPRVVMCIVSGKSYRCDCGCNVFTETKELKYKCNSCSAVYIGTK